MGSAQVAATCIQAMPGTGGSKSWPTVTPNSKYTSWVSNHAVARAVRGIIATSEDGGRQHCQFYTAVAQQNVSKLYCSPWRWWAQVAVSHSACHNGRTPVGECPSRRQRGWQQTVATKKAMVLALVPPLWGLLAAAAAWGQQYLYGAGGGGGFTILRYNSYYLAFFVSISFILVFCGYIVSGLI